MIREFVRAVRGPLATTLSILVFIALVVALIWSVVVSYPADTSISKSYTLPYLPKNLEVGTITNMFVERVSLGGAGGIAAVQADEPSLKDYIARTSETEGMHYLSVSPSSSCQCQQINVDYYYEKPSSIVLRHYSYQIPTPTYDKWLVSGYYEVKSYQVEDGKLVIQGKFVDNGSCAFLVVIIWVMGTVFYFILVNQIKQYTWWW
jgi:hypothetical protein